MDKKIYPTLYWTCDYLSIVGLKFVVSGKEVTDCWDTRICKNIKSSQRNVASHKSSVMREGLAYILSYNIYMVLLCFALLLLSYRFLWIRIMNLSILFRVASPILGQLWDCSCLVKWSWVIWVKSIATTLQWSHNRRDCVSNHQPYDRLLNRVFRSRSKKTSKLRVTGLCPGNSPGTDEFPTQMSSNAENVSISWRHYDKTQQTENHVHISGDTL